MGLTQGRVGQVIRWTDGERELFFYLALLAAHQKAWLGVGTAHWTGAVVRKDFLFTIS